MRKAENTGLFLHEKPEFEALQDAMAARGTGTASSKLCRTPWPPEAPERPGRSRPWSKRCNLKNNLKENNVLHSTTTIPFNHYHPPPPTNNVSGR